MSERYPDLNGGSTAFDNIVFWTTPPSKCPLNIVLTPTICVLQKPQPTPLLWCMAIKKMPLKCFIWPRCIAIGATMCCCPTCMRTAWARENIYKWDGKTAFDVMRWSEVANQLFRSSTANSQQVLHGVSMGAATVMCVSGETTPSYVRCFVEDCGYTDVWSEFKSELKNQFSLPAFPLLYTSSWLTNLRLGLEF